MLYQGAWHEELVPFDAGHRPAFLRHAARRFAAQDNQPADLPTDRFISTTAGTAPAGRTNVCGVLVHGEVRASFVYCTAYDGPRLGRVRPVIAHAAIWVEPEWRLMGMARALLLRGISIARQGGIRHLVFESLGDDGVMRKLVQEYPADLIFEDGDCQAWLDLCTDAAATELVGAR
jgi:GNAT superfamily N-acetyltransferase